MQQRCLIVQLRATGYFFLSSTVEGTRTGVENDDSAFSFPSTGMAVLYFRDDFEEIERNYTIDAKQEQKSDHAFLCSCMRNGISSRDRKQMLRVVPKCFLGSEAVDWMLNHPRFSGCKTRKEAEALGEQLREEGFLSSAPITYAFQDKSTCLYRFKVGLGQPHRARS